MKSREPSREGGTMSMPSSYKIHLGLGLLVLLCAAPLLLAWDEKQPDRKVRVSVVVILANETDTKIDKKLECIAREVSKMHPRLTGFRMGTLSCKSLQI